MMTFKQIMKSVAIRSYNFARPFVMEDAIPIGENATIVNSYSQTGEDLFIDAILGCKENGRYVDVGANDPVSISNTKRFYDRGWSGILIEPNPTKYEELRRARPRDTVLNCGVSNAEGRLPFYILDKHTVSSFSHDSVTRMRIERGASVEKTIEVKVFRLGSILDKYLYGRKIDFMSIDVEGFEIPVLESNDWNKYRPSIILIEYVANPKFITTFLPRRNYIPVFRNAENIIYVDKTITGDNA